MQSKSNKNAYHRIRYELNIKEERKRQIEKYHRTKKLFCDLTEEEKEIKRQKNRKNYENWQIRQSEKLKVEKKPKQLKKLVKPKEKPTKKTEPKIENMPIKKFRLPERINHKYVSDVLRNFPKSRLCNVLISSWKIGELKEFEELEKLLTEK